MGTEHFDTHATTWDEDEDKRRRSEEIARAVAAVVPTAAGTRLLEYGAGTGLVTQALLDAAPGAAGQVTLADNSSGMRAVLQDKVDDGRLPSEARVWDLDLVHDEVPAERFDLIVSSMVLHHVHALDPVLAGLAAMLEDGGHLCVADLDLEDGSFHADTHDFDGHDGFNRGELARAMAAAGLEVVDVADAASVEKHGRTYPVFLMTARRTAREPLRTGRT